MQRNPALFCKPTVQPVLWTRNLCPPRPAPWAEGTRRHVELHVEAARLPGGSAGLVAGPEDLQLLCSHGETAFHLDPDLPKSITIDGRDGMVQSDRYRRKQTTQRNRDAMNGSPLQPTTFELFWLAYAIITVLVLAFATVRYINGSLKLSELLLAVVASLAVPIVGGPVVMYWLFKTSGESGHISGASAG